MFAVRDRVAYTRDILDRVLVETRSATVSGVTTITGVTQTSYDLYGRVSCTAVRMNPAAWGALPSSACTLGTEGAQGPDRIERNVYDLAGQLLQVRRAVGTALEQATVTYTYSASGRQASVTDANGNRAELGYDGLDRQSRWTFPSKTNVGQVDASDYEAYAYDNNGNRTSLRKRDNQTIFWSYDALDRPVLKDAPGTAADVATSYDNRGLPQSVTFTASGLGLATTFDALGRAVSITDNSCATAAYACGHDGPRSETTERSFAVATHAMMLSNRTIWPIAGEQVQRHHRAGRGQPMSAVSSLRAPKMTNGVSGWRLGLNALRSAASIMFRLRATAPGASRLSRRFALEAIVLFALFGWDAPTKANDWVTGEVATVADYTGHGIGGVVIVLTNQAWPYSSIGCTDKRFSIRLGEQGVNEETKNRMWSALLTAAAAGRRVALYVDASTTTLFCPVQIVSFGTILP